MAKISPVAQFLQANSAKAKLLTESHYYGKDAFGWVKKSNFVDKNFSYFKPFLNIIKL